MNLELQEEIFLNLPGGMDDNAYHYSLFATKYDNLRFPAKRKGIVQTFIVVQKWIGFT
jgi:hypothetical protein